jgi:hypothetical protein
MDPIGLHLHTCSDHAPFPVGRALALTLGGPPLERTRLVVNHEGGWHDYTTIHDAGP